MSYENKNPRAMVSSVSSSSTASRPATRQVITTDQGEVEPVPRYSSARGCMTIMGIAFVCLMLMLLYMFLFNEGR